MFEYLTLRIFSGGIVPDSGESLLQEIILRESLRTVVRGVVDWIVAGTDENKVGSGTLPEPTY
jgi:hypothetical protein